MKMIIFAAALLLAAFQVKICTAENNSAQLKEKEQEILKLEESRDRIKSILDKSLASQQLIIPIHTEGEWIAVEVPKEELNALLSLWVITEKKSTEDALSHLQSVIHFTNQYQQELQIKLEDIEKKLAAIQTLPTEKKESAPISINESKPVERNLKPGPIPKNQAYLTLTVENIKKEEKPGQKRWDFDWVFTEHNGVGVTLTDYEMRMTSPIPEANKNFNQATNIRIEPGHVFRGPGYMWIEGTDPDDTENMHAQLYTVYRGKDDNGNTVFLENYFFQ